jgi:hypothetical protein
MKLLHASPGFGVQLTENEIIEFMSHGKLNLHLGTIDVDNYPNITLHGIFMMVLKM